MLIYKKSKVMRNQFTEIVKLIRQTLSTEKLLFIDNQGNIIVPSLMAQFADIRNAISARIAQSSENRLQFCNFISNSWFMDILIDFDGINDSSKKEWLLQTLKLMGIRFQEIEKPQTQEEYNQELEEGEEEILKGNFVTHEQLLKRMTKKWK